MCKDVSIPPHFIRHGPVATVEPQLSGRIYCATLHHDEVGHRRAAATRCANPSTGSKLFIRQERFEQSI